MTSQSRCLHLAQVELSMLRQVCWLSGPLGLAQASSYFHQWGVGSSLSSAATHPFSSSPDTLELGVRQGFFPHFLKPSFPGLQSATQITNIQAAPWLWVLSWMPKTRREPHCWLCSHHCMRICCGRNGSCHQSFLSPQGQSTKSMDRPEAY